MDEIKRLSTSELGEMKRALVKKDRQHVQLKRQLASASAEQTRTKEVSLQKVDLLQRERKELVRALHSIGSHCTSARSTVEPVYGREEVLPKKVEPWLSLTYDGEYVPSPRTRSGRSTISRGMSMKTLPFNGAGTPLLDELVSLVEDTTTKYVSQSKLVSGITAERRQLKEQLKAKTEENGELTEWVNIVMEEVREGNRQRGMEDDPGTSEFSDRVKLKIIHKQLKTFNSRDEEISQKCKDLETQAVELQFYAKLHGKLVQQAVYDTLTASGKIAA